MDQSTGLNRFGGSVMALESTVDLLSENGPPKSLEEVEKEVISWHIQFNRYNITRAIKTLGISRSTLYRKIKAYGLETRPPVIPPA